jgi:hypothetical protein
MRLENGAIRHVVRDLAHAVHVVGKAQQLGGDLVLGQHAKRRAHHGRARHLAEGTDMRQAGRAVAGLEQHDIGELVLFVTLDDLARFLERPGFRFRGGLTQFGCQIECGQGRIGAHGLHSWSSGVFGARKAARPFVRLPLQPHACEAKRAALPSRQHARGHS